MARIPNRPPQVRKIQIKGLVIALAGREKPYDVYRFSEGRVKFERPGHNPFAGMTEEEIIETLEVWGYGSGAAIAYGSGSGVEL